MNSLFWGLTPCNMVEVFRRFEGTYCLRLRGRRLCQVTSMKMKLVYSSEKLESFCQTTPHQTPEYIYKKKFIRKRINSKVIKRREIFDTFQCSSRLLTKNVKIKIGRTAGHNCTCCYMGLNSCLLPQGDYTGWAVFENRDRGQCSLDLKEGNSDILEKIKQLELHNCRSSYHQILLGSSNHQISMRREGHITRMGLDVDAMIVLN